MSDQHVVSEYLPDIQRAFVLSHVLDFNIKRTAKRIGVSIERCRKFAKLPEITRELDIMRAEIAQECMTTHAEILNEISLIALHDPKENIKEINAEGKIIFKDLNEMDTRVLSEITTGTTSDGKLFTKISTHSKLKALEILNNHFEGMPEEKHLHIHVTPDDLKDRTASQCADDYTQLLNQGGISCPIKVKEEPQLAGIPADFVEVPKEE